MNHSALTNCPATYCWKEQIRTNLCLLFLQHSADFRFSSSPHLSVFKQDIFIFQICLKLANRFKSFLSDRYLQNNFIILTFSGHWQNILEVTLSCCSKICNDNLKKNHGILLWGNLGSFMGLGWRLVNFLPPQSTKALFNQPGFGMKFVSCTCLVL